MNKQNPWEHFPHNTYENHMGHENVCQIEMLSHILNNQLALVKDNQNAMIAILGITSGNGLSNIKPGQYKSIIGMDINKEYLNICRERYAYLTKLELYQIDLMIEKERAVEILKHTDLITANLLIKHIHLNNFIDIVSQLINPIVSAVIQYNPDGQSLSHSGYEDLFEDIVNHAEDCDETVLNTAMRNAGYVLFGKKEYELPNKKVFIRLDYIYKPINIRLSVADDAANMAEIHARSWEAAYRDIIPADYIKQASAKRPAQWINILSKENTTIYVIERDGRAVGNLSVAAPQDNDLGEEFYELQGIYLHPDYYRQGIGSQAMEFAYKIARDLGKTAMSVWVFAENVNSVKFYEKCGFTADGKTKMYNMNKELEAIRMRRDL